MLCHTMVSDKPGGLSVCRHPLPQEIWQPVKIAFWPFLFSKLLNVSAVFWSFRCIFKSKLLCKQSRPIKSKGQNIKPRCYHIGNFSTMASVLYRENSNSSQEVKLQAKLPAKKKHPQTVDTDNQTFNCNNADGHSQTGNRKNIDK